MKNELKLPIVLNWIFGFLLLASIILNISQMQDAPEASVVGTFLHPDEGVTGLHLVMEWDGEFMLYRQFEVLEVGTYTGLGDGIFYLQSTTSDFSAQIVYRENNYIYLFSAGQTVLSFHRISDIPTYINVLPIGMDESDIEAAAVQ